MIDYLIGSVLLVLGTAGAAVVLFTFFRLGSVWSRHALAIARDHNARARTRGRGAHGAYIGIWVGLFPAMLVLYLAMAVRPAIRNPVPRDVGGMSPNGYQPPVSSRR